MNTKILITLFGLAAVAIPAVAPAGQAPAGLAGQQPPARTALTEARFRLLLADPAAVPQLHVVLPERFTAAAAL